MATPETPIERLLASLQERAKELNCLYGVDEILADPDLPLADACRRIADVLPAGWQYPDACCARLRVRGVECRTSNFRETAWAQTQRILAEGKDVGEIAVHYTEERPPSDEGPFLKEERRLIETIAQRIGFFLTRQDLRRAHESLHDARAAGESGSAEWNVILDFLRRTDPDLLRRVTRRLVNHLGLLGIPEAERLLQRVALGRGDSAGPTDDNLPVPKSRPQDLMALSEETFRIARRNLGEEELVASIRQWLDEERSTFLVEVLEDQSCTLSEIVDAVGRHESQIGATPALSAPARSTLSAALLRRLFTDDLDYVNVAKDHLTLEDVYDVVKRIVYPSRGQGKLGGKSAGLCLAMQLLRKSDSELLRAVKVPKTWYVSSDVALEFINHNNLRELYFRKYLPIEQVRQEYPHIIHVMKNSNFPPEISRGLALALDDFESTPLIVRSSSLLEDRMGSSFAGKYKSLFLGNQGSRQARQAALEDAIAEIYASIFSPDAIQYRVERGLINVHEEMGIMIQEVVGHRIGRYYLPSFSGVALSNNEFRWSPRIRRHDGLLRMVPGLGTRAVDRVGDDYPVLVAPGQPGLRVNVTPDEVARYSPRWMDVIDLATNKLVTVAVDAFLKECGADLPGVREMVSIAEEGRIRKPVGLEPDFERDQLVVTFQGLMGTSSSFLEQMSAALQCLSEKLGKPVDLEFASDGESQYLLQCRAQSRSEDYAPAPIPRNLPREMVLFSAHRNISNGRVPDITHVVYIDPDRYAELEDARSLREVGKVVGRLNGLLPKRQFVLMGPGRWGSRGDIRLGVPVTYADVSNAAVLMEIARQKGNYVPELSFGTHFFQDMVESEIRYIPIYPDREPNVLDEAFLRRARNMLPEVLPEASGLDGVVRVIDVASEKQGNVLRVLMNADLDEAAGIFDAPRKAGSEVSAGADAMVEPPAEAHWRWRLRMVERIGAELEAERFGVESLYVIGSVKNATAGPGSDIDLLIHDAGDERARRELSLWLEGWSKALAEVNFLRTGYKSEGLLDVHWVTDEDIRNRTSFASKIGAVTDPAREVPLRNTQARRG
jgi:hypothetical protein